MKPLRALTALALILALLAGCSGLSYENLYTLPRASEEYYGLQEALTGILESGFNYAAPASGARQEPVQLIDLDGDGTDEAVAFFRATDTGTVTIYILSQSGDEFSPSAVIEGAGTGVASVRYADLDGTGMLELIISYQVSESVAQALQVYRYTGQEAASVITTGCSHYELWDLSGDGLQELICLSGGGADAGAMVECYGCQDGELQRLGEQYLHVSYDSLRQIRQGRITGASAIVFSGVSAEGLLLTDVLTVDGGSLVTVSPRQEILSSAPIHSYYVYPDDLDGDGLLEIPETRQLDAYDEGSGAQWVIDWYSLSASGSCRKVTTTYQNFGENWYLEIPAVWEDTLIIKAGDESTTVSTVTLYHSREDEPLQEILTIFTLRGSDRQQYAADRGLTILVNDNEMILAVSLPDAEPWDGSTDLSQISELFHYTRSGWSGDASSAQDT